MEQAIYQAATPYVSHAAANSVPLNTCVSCRLSYETMAELKEHYRDDLHRANLRRKVAGAPPLAAAEFAALRDSLTTPTVGSAHQRKGVVGGKDKHSRKLAKQGRRVERHEQRLAKMEEKQERQAAQAEKQQEEATMTEEEVMQWRVENAVEIAPEQCIFSRKTLGSVESKLEWMSKHYGFFIPYIEYLSDLDGMLEYLTRKITIGYTCWHCNKLMGSYEACTKHMVAKSHCKLPDDFFDELAEFYTVPTTDAELAAEAAELAAQKAEEDEWEEMTEEERIAAEAPDPDDDGADDDESEGEEGEDQFDDGAAAAADVEEEEGVLDVELNEEIVLRDGRRLGNRSLRRYYKQTHKPERELPASVRAAKQERLDLVLAGYRRSGQMIKQQKMGRPMLSQAEKKWQVDSQRREMRARNKQGWQTSELLKKGGHGMGGGRFAPRNSVTEH